MALQTTATDTAMSRARKFARGAAIGALAFSLAACGSMGDPFASPFSSSKERRADPDVAAANVTSIGVNSYLWRAALESLSFMPLVQADSTGGVIVTDWYSNPQNPNERMKVTVSILDQDLRADALRVAANRQVLQDGNWVEAPVQAATVQSLEDVILTKARDLRRSAIG